MNNLIYKATCMVNGKVYIGLTTNGLGNRVKNHTRTSKSTTRNSLFYNAIKKYGKDNFVWDVLEYCDIQEIEARERFWIKYFDSYINGYNSTTGGELKKEYSIESRIKMSDGHKGQVAWNKGKKCKPCSESQKVKIKAFAELYREQNRINQKNRKAIICKETGQIFNSIRECCSIMGLNRLSVSRNLSGAYHSAGGYWNNGYHFEQIIPADGGYNS